MNSHKTGLLSKVLQIKDQEKQEIEIQVRGIRQEIQVAEASLKTLEDEMDRLTDSYHEKLRAGALHGHELAVYYNYFMRLYGDINSQRTEMTKRIEALNRKEAQLLNAYREKKLFESLQDRVTLEALRESESLKQKDMDYQYLTRRTRGF